MTYKDWIPEDDGAIFRVGVFHILAFQWKTKRKELFSLKGTISVLSSDWWISGFAPKGLGYKKWAILYLSSFIRTTTRTTNMLKVALKHQKSKSNPYDYNQISEILFFTNQTLMITKRCVSLCFFRTLFWVLVIASL
jgi:hypothetical protein